VIREAGTAEFESWAADPTGRYVFSNALTLNYNQFYVLDMLKGAFVARADRPKGDRYPEIANVDWKPGAATARILWYGEGDVGKEEKITLKWSP
jgi:hypothetical protein